MQTIGDFTNMSESLALMPDEALRTFAQMHRDDPFSLALAVSESNRRKKQRVAQQGLAGMQPQPPVADQEIAQMNEPAMPENVGIGALPAPVLAGMPAGGIAGEEEMEPQTMAGGGLVAFSGGGNVERYQSQGLVQPPASGGTEFAIPGMVQPSRSFMPQAGAPSATPFLRRKFDEMQEEGRRYQLAQAQARINMGVGTAADRALVTAYAEGSAPAATDVSARAATPTPAGAAPSLLNPAVVQPVGAPPGAASDTAASGAAAADTTQRQKPPAPGAAPDAAPVTFASADDLQRQYARILAAQSSADPEAAERELLGLEGIGRASAKQKAVEARQKLFADAFKGREERLTKQEAEMGKRADLNTGLSLLNAGLAIMSTPGGLATAIGRGARVGTEQYAAGLEKLQAAKDKAVEARDRLEELKLNRAEMSAKEADEAADGILAAQMDARKLGIEGRALARGESRSTAAKIFEAATANARAAMQERGATARNVASVNATNNAPDRQYFAALVQKHKGDTVKAYEEFATTRQEAKTDASLVAQYAKDPMALKLLETTDPAMAAMIKARIQQSMVPQAQTAPTGAVRD
jgi:hypothetical protein